MKLRLLTELNKASHAVLAAPTTKITRKNVAPKTFIPDSVQESSTLQIPQIRYLQECNYTGMTEEEEESMHFFGTEPGSDDHKRMVQHMKVLKKANPSLYNKIHNLH